MALGWNTPLLFQPRLEFVFLSTCRIVSRAMLSTRCNSTTLSASICNVQRSRPSSAAEHVSAMRYASCSPSNLRGYRLLGFCRLRAACIPSSTKRCRTRSTLAVPTSRASLIAGSDHAGPPSPLSAFTQMRACANFRADACPCVISLRNSSRSSSSNFTIYFFIGSLLGEFHLVFVSLPRLPPFPSSHQITMDRTLVQNWSALPTEFCEMRRLYAQD